MLKFTYAFLIFILLTTFIAGCGSSHKPAVTAPQTVTYAAQIQKLITDNCLGCHSFQKTGITRYGAPANSNYDTYEQLVSNAVTVNAYIQAGQMPPDGGLSAADRKLFQDWLDDGKLR
ncbi:MAG: hypothetical protein A3F83_11545 [Candidatus Glassbacteria bacterium RIFCSPLOWO2_12_FULL_58_11]|uniref:Cytochrome c domain-containing protein n=2 Tax=Candidatus Glassiibacteriota TaxID=1817805 RepID=A0A1F5YRB8_9BACT|nr:MAG: hypothetical protein A3F83_11545 [Candidatus Glassbacteria bacterium RIFCSPLOWO2_12_FULL_58_11]